MFYPRIFNREREPLSSFPGMGIVIQIRMSAVFTVGGIVLLHLHCVHVTFMAHFYGRLWWANFGRDFFATLDPLIYQPYGNQNSDEDFVRLGAPISTVPGLCPTAPLTIMAVTTVDGLRGMAEDVISSFDIRLGVE